MMLKINVIKTICFLLLIGLLLTASSCLKKPQRQKYITIGALLPLTGELSAEGLRTANGLQIAKEEINENGGILGKKLDIIILNDKNDEKYILKQYNALKEKGVVAIIGSNHSGATIALVKVAEKDGIPVISPTASSPYVTLYRRNIFRAIFVDDYQAEIMAHLAYHSLGARTAVVLSSRAKVNYGQMARFFADFFKANGGQVIGTEPFYSEDDFPDILKKYAANPPDVIFCSEDYIPAASLINTVYELGFENTSLLGSDGWDGVLSYVNNPDAKYNVFYLSPFSSEDQDENVAKFVRKYFNYFSQMPLSGSANGYSCVYILAEAIEKAGTTDCDSVVSAIKTNEMHILTGNIKFDEYNNPRINVYILHIKDNVHSIYQKLIL